MNNSLAAMPNDRESLLACQGARAAWAMVFPLAWCWLIGCATRVPPDSSYSHSSVSLENPAMKPAPNNPSLPRVFTAEGSAQLAQPVARTIRGALKDRRLRPAKD